MEAAEDFMNFSIWFVGHKKPDIEKMLVIYFLIVLIFAACKVGRGFSVRLKAP